MRVNSPHVFRLTVVSGKRSWKCVLEVLIGRVFLDERYVGAVLCMLGEVGEAERMDVVVARERSADEWCDSGYSDLSL
jgi:hypothetical protein